MIFSSIPQPMSINNKKIAEMKYLIFKNRWNIFFPFLSCCNCLINPVILGWDSFLSLNGKYSNDGVFGQTNNQLSLKLLVLCKINPDTLSF
jgi:hypothetical protein